MYRPARKTAPKVRDGRVQKKNRWERSVDADEKLLSKAGITFETRSPGPGRRHVLTEIDVQRFVRCRGKRGLARGDVELPRGEEFAESWAVRMEELVWPRYKEFFGVPGRVRMATAGELESPPLLVQKADP